MTSQYGLHAGVRLIFAITVGIQLVPDAVLGQVMHLKPGQKQLFLDDEFIRDTNGLTRTMHQPQKRGAVLKPDTPSDGYMVQMRAAPEWVEAEKLYKIIYLAYNPVGAALAVSRDGLTWDKPDLGLIEIGGNRHNNHVRAPIDAWPNNSFTDFVYDPRDRDPARRYKGLIGAEKREPIISPDGLTWTLIKGSPIPSGDESQLIYDQTRGEFLATVKSYNKYGRAVSLATSRDFVHWTKPVEIFSTDDEDQRLTRQIIKARLKDRGLWPPMYLDPEPPSNTLQPTGGITAWSADVYNMAIFPYEGIYIGLPAVLYHTGLDAKKTNVDGFHHIQLAMSRDLKIWKRLGNREAFIGPSRIDHGLMGIFDRTQLLPGSRPIEHGDELWFYYSGLKWRDCRYQYHKDGKPIQPSELPPQERADLAEGHAAMCLAVLRRDGFISLDAGDSEGCLETKPFVFHGKTLYVNLDASKGSARVELLNSKNEVLSESMLVSGNAVRTPVQWKTKIVLSDLNGQTVHLKVYLRKAGLYAVWTE